MLRCSSGFSLVMEQQISSAKNGDGAGPPHPPTPTRLPRGGSSAGRGSPCCSELPQGQGHVVLVPHVAPCVAENRRTLGSAGARVNETVPCLLSPSFLHSLFACEGHGQGVGLQPLLI